MSQRRKSNDTINFFDFFRIMIFAYLTSLGSNPMDFEVYLPLHQVDTKCHIN